MDKNDKKLFSQLNSPEPPAGLFERIMHRINTEQRLLALRCRVVIFSIGLVGSMAAFIPVFKMMQAGFAESGFINFFSLIFSDFGIVITYWQNFTLALLESLPVASIAALFIVIFIFLESLKFLARDIKFFFVSKQIINN